jgi:heme exporter protein D
MPEACMTAHALYVSAAYAISALALAALVIWILADQRARRRELAELEASGLRRPSHRPKEEKLRRITNPKIPARAL